ncbi:MAG: hypothetical protein RL091_3124 [Verrucomicrobiota bacterium]|jgi:hypothetical protein
MKNLATVFLLSLAATTVLTAEAPVDRFAGLKPKIEELLNQRLNPVPLPAKPANPFQFFQPGIERLTPSDPLPVVPLPTQTVQMDDNQILAYSVARLRISGQVLRNGVTMLLINSATYREGDLVPVRTTNDTVYYVRIVQIRDNEVVLGYNEALVNVRLP